MSSALSGSLQQQTVNQLKLSQLLCLLVVPMTRQRRQKD